MKQLFISALILFITLHLNAQDQVEWSGSTASGEIYRSNGNIGIGISIPDNNSKLHVQGNTQVDGILVVSNYINLGSTPIKMSDYGNVILIGSDAGKNINNSLHNIFIGRSAGSEFIGTNNNGSNIYIGDKSGFNNSNGSQNLFIGMESGSQSTGSFNVILGAFAGKNVVNNNVIIGGYAGQYNYGASNTFIGRSAGSGIDETQFANGTGNLCLGNESGWHNLAGTGNVYLGNRSGRESSGSQNVFIGNKTGEQSTGDGNIFIGTNITKNVDNTLIIDNDRNALPLIYGKFDTNVFGINTNNPEHTLDVGGTINAIEYLLDGQPMSSSQWSTITSNISYTEGKVSIGTDTPEDGYLLTVNGEATMEKVKVQILPDSGPDYVFAEEYNLRSLESTSNYIKENKHLPEIPSAKEMETNGIELGEMNMKLLQKIEELTLHLIKQNEEIEALKKEMAEIKAGK